MIHKFTHSKNYCLVLLFLFFSFAKIAAQPCKEVVGYYPAWQWYDRGQLVNPQTIDYSKYTVINYAFFAPNADGTIVGTDPWADENLLLGQINWSTTPTSYYPNTSIVDLAHNNGVKFLISVGGWTLSNNFPSIAADPTKLATFASECVRLIDTYNLDGIDIDWEYPGYAPHNGSPADKQNFTTFLQAIRIAIDDYGESVGKEMLLTAAVGAAPSHAVNVEWDSVKNLLDMINLMSYDFYGSWDAVSNHNSPLHPPAVGNAALSVASAFEMFTQTYNVAPEKLNLGIAFYGRSLTGCTALHGTHSGGVDAATFADDEGMPMYYNILDKMNLFTRYWDSTAEVPYLLGNNIQTFLSYDDEESIAKKAQYAVDNDARGVIIWEITGDYIETFPNSGVIAGTPLADTLNAVLCGGIVVPTEPPIANFEANAIAICEGESVNFSDLSVNTPTAWQWIFEGGTANNVNAQNPTVVYQTAGQYSVSLTVSNEFGTDEMTQTELITVYENPIANAGADMSIDYGESIVLNATGGINYVWNNAETLDNAFIASPQANPTETTTYSVTVTSVNGCESIDEVTITVANTPICELPQNIMISNITETTAEISWQEVVGAALYEVEYRALGSSILVQNTTINSYNLTNLNMAMAYEIRVQAICDNGVSSGFSTWQSFNTLTSQNTEMRVKAKAFLEGTFHWQAGYNICYLAAYSLLPLSQPYHVAPWNYAGTESVSGFWATDADWVLIEARDADNPELVIERRAGILQQDGTVRDIDFTEGVKFYNLTANDSYFIVLRHRNHIDVMSKNAVLLPNLTAYDFTLQNNVKNGETQLTPANTFGYAMRMGDIEANGTISIGDMNAYLQNATGFLEYLSADTDMNGVVNVADYEKILPNMSVISVKEVR